MNKIEGHLKNLSAFHVSAEKDIEILKALDNRLAERNFAFQKTSFISFLTPFVMNTKKIVAVCAVFVLAVIGVMYYNTTNSYAYHLDKAKGALEQLQLVLEGKETTAFIPAAYAEGEEVVVDEAAVAELAEEVVTETEGAIEAVEEVDNAPETAEALAEVSDVQDETVEVLSDAAEVVQEEATAEVVADALETTTEEQAAVEAAVEQVQAAVESGAEEVQIEVTTTADVPQTEVAAESEGDTEDAVDTAEALANAEAAKAALNALISSGNASDEEVAKLADKMNKIEAALAEGKVGRVHGLTTAVQAKVRNIERKAEKNVVESPDATTEAVTEDAEDVAEPAENTTVETESSTGTTEPAVTEETEAADQPEVTEPETQVKENKGKSEDHKPVKTEASEEVED